MAWELVLKRVSKSTAVYTFSSLNGSKKVFVVNLFNIFVNNCLWKKSGLEGGGGVGERVLPYISYIGSSSKEYGFLSRFSLKYDRNFNHFG